MQLSVVAAIMFLSFAMRGSIVFFYAFFTAFQVRGAAVKPPLACLRRSLDDRDIAALGGHCETQRPDLSSGIFDHRSRTSGRVCLHSATALGFTTVAPLASQERQEQNTNTTAATGFPRILCCCRVYRPVIDPQGSEHGRRSL